MSTKNQQPVKLGWAHFPSLPTEGGEATTEKHRAFNDLNGMIVGEIVVEGDRAVYTSYMPKSAGEQRAFINAEKAKQWVEERYASNANEKPKAPELPG